MEASEQWVILHLRDEKGEELEEKEECQIKHMYPKRLSKMLMLDYISPSCDSLTQLTHLIHPQPQPQTNLHPNPKSLPQSLPLPIKLIMSPQLPSIPEEQPLPKHSPREQSLPKHTPREQLFPRHAPRKQPLQFKKRKCVRRSIRSPSVMLFPHQHPHTQTK